jgi:beta-lactamase superfamily II metal-dependent hydrolase
MRIFLFLIVAIGQLFLGAELLAGPADGRLDIYWIDTEGGAATLIVTPAGESVLIDSGNPGARDAGRIFNTATQVAGLKRIDNLVTTHYHIDHFGGAATLAGLMPIGNVWDNGEFKEGWERPSKEYLEFKCEKRVVLSAGDEIPLKNLVANDAAKVGIRCLAARKKFVEAPAGAVENPDSANAKRKRDDPSDNANSIVTLISFGPFRFFVGGDLTWNMEEKLVCPVNLVGPVDVYQVTHHGLDISNNPVVVRALAPTVAVMSNGTTKGSAGEVFATLRGTASVQAIFQVHRNLRADKENNTTEELTANLEEACQGNYIKLSVEPNGKNYKVSIPATKHERTYQTKAGAKQ